MTPAIVVIDGEHYPPVLRDAIAGLPYEVIGAWLAGGTEKLRGEPDYGVPLVEALEDSFADAEVVVDLSDEPVLGPRERMLIASRVLAAGLRYEGADFRFEPPQYAPFPLPSLAVIGTGKRVGKTAVTGHVARLLARDRDVVVVAMGRGGRRSRRWHSCSRRLSRCSTFRARAGTQRPTISRLPRSRGS
jgi:cyclic 2,3-diphosphoglycerate synthetase